MEEFVRMLASLEFASPLYFWVGMAIILSWIFSPIFRKKRALRFDLGYWSKKMKLGSKKVWVVPVLLVITSILISAAIANPQLIEKRSVPFYGKPVMVVLDISGSMGTKGSGEKAKELFYDIVERDLGAAIGLLLYSDENYIARDFATKIELFKDTIDNEREIIRISSGTNTAKALLRAERFFSEKVQAEDRSIILISDLEDSLYFVSRAMEKVLEEDIKIYVIVVQEEPEKAHNIIQQVKGKVGNGNVEMVWSGDKDGIDQICEAIRQMESSLTGEEETLSQRSLGLFLLPVIIGLIILCIVLSETTFRKVP